MFHGANPGLAKGKTEKGESAALNSLPIAYRPDVDGLRAVAIIPVVLFHAFPGLVPGGFVGVDVFFVISGFLISSIILADLGKNRFSFKQFYSRRICRIFPALILVLAFCLVAGWLTLLPDEYRLLGKHVRGGALYISNFILKGEAGYFQVAADLKPLLHLWSLAIEEQFYIVFPFAVVLAFRYRLNVFNILLLFAISSFAYNVYRITSNPVATFFLPGTRVWELLIGALLAQVGHFGWTGLGTRIKAAVPAVSADVRAALGLAAIAVAVAVLDRDAQFPGWWAAVPALGAALLIAAGPSAWVNRRLLAHPLMVSVGLISYPLYLWHWPLLSLARIILGDGVTWPLLAGLVLLSVALAVLTHRLIEHPIRYGTASRFRTAVVLAALCFGVGAAGHAVLNRAVAPYADRFGVGRIIAAAGEWEYPGGMERLSLERRAVFRRKGGGTGAVLFVGDSNIEQYAPRVQAVAATRPDAKTAYFLTGGGCAPIAVVSEATHPHCNGLVDAAVAAADAYGVDTVVIGAQWWGYFTSAVYGVDGVPLRESAAAERALDSLGETIRRLSGGKRRVFLVLNIPIGLELNPRSQVERSFMSFAIKEQGIPLASLRAKYGEVSERIAAIAHAAGATVIDPLPLLCTPAGNCPASTADGDPIYKDEAHLRPLFVRNKVEYLDAALR
ncbi:MAG: acyltransferase family protein [Solirubrobacterales bacterium]